MNETASLWLPSYPHRITLQGAHSFGTPALHAFVLNLGLPLILFFYLLAISSHFLLPPLGPGSSYFFKILHPTFKKSVYRALTLEPYTQLRL